MICFTGYGVVAEKPRVRQLTQFFPCTLYQKLCVGSNKWLHLFNSLDVLYQLAKFEEDRTTRAGCRCENTMFVCLFFVTLRGRRAVRSRGYTLSRYCVAVYGSILMRFSAFSRRDCPFRCARSFSFLLIGGATIFGKLRSKIVKSSKTGEKVGAHHFVQISERF